MRFEKLIFFDWFLYSKIWIGYGYMKEIIWGVFKNIRNNIWNNVKILRVIFIVVYDCNIFCINNVKCYKFLYFSEFF